MTLWYDDVLLREGKVVVGVVGGGGLFSNSQRMNRC